MGFTLALGVTTALDERRPRVVIGESVILIDDLFTMASTVSACANALKEAGANDVLELTVVRR